MSHQVLRVGTLVLVALLGSCLDDSGPGILPPPPSPGFVVSNPLGEAASGSTASINATVGAGPDVVYVSLSPGTVPDGGLATIRNTRTGDEAHAAMAEGGFDPVPIAAVAGDTLSIDIELAGASHQILRMVAPVARRPVVVRTDPPPKKRDVPLNTSIMIVFSEPIDPSTVGGVSLSRAGAPVSGHTTVSADGLRATFQADQALVPNADYVVTVTTDIHDASGDPLEQTVGAQFTTGTTTIAAWIVTPQAALLATPISSAPRAFSMYAIKDDTGGVSGTFQIFLSDPGWLTTGRVTCFTTADNTAWVAGVVETSVAAQDSGLELGWRAVDNGAPSGGAPDQLSLAFPLASSGLGTARDFCASKPTIDPADGTEIALYDLLAGDLLIANGTGGPPPPPPPPQPPAAGISQIAYAYSGGGIQVVAADGSFAWQLTSAPGDLYPAWSPDGTKIAFQSDRRRPGSGFGNIYVMKYDGSGVTRLTSDPLSELEPAWSPNGREIAFDRGADVYIMNADGSGATRVASGGHASWSPDGVHLVFADLSGHLSITNTDGSGLRPLTSEASSIDEMPAWSPDGQRIAFHRRPPGAKYGAVYLVNADGGGIAQLTLKGQRPQWSPDSRRIVFEFNGIYLINIDGSGLTRLGTGFTPTWSFVGTMPPAPRADRSIAIIGGDAQRDSIHATLPQLLRVQVLEPSGAPAVGVVVSWVLDPDGNDAALSVDRSTTDSSGIASVALTLGSAPGVQQVVALITDGSAKSPGVAFTATVNPGP